MQRTDSSSSCVALCNTQAITERNNNGAAGGSAPGEEEEGFCPEALSAYDPIHPPHLMSASASMRSRDGGSPSSLPGGGSDNEADGTAGGRRSNTPIPSLTPPATAAASVVAESTGPSPLTVTAARDASGNGGGGGAGGGGGGAGTASRSSMDTSSTQPSPHSLSSPHHPEAYHDATPLSSYSLVASSGAAAAGAGGGGGVSSGGGEKGRSSDRGSSQRPIAPSEAAVAQLRQILGEGGGGGGEGGGDVGERGRPGASVQPSVPTSVNGRCELIS